jgi:hypothetical protein
MMRCYFRSRDGRAVVPFSDSSESVVTRAYQTARRTGCDVLSHPLPYAGPWDRMALVGYRSRMALESELTQALIRLPSCLGTDHEREATLAIKRTQAELDALLSYMTSRRAKPAASEAA